MDDPGANKSTHEPQLEKLERAPVLVIEPTVMAAGAAAGEVLQALASLLPAAATNRKLLVRIAAIAFEISWKNPPPRLALRIAGTPEG